MMTYSKNVVVCHLVVICVVISFAQGAAAQTTGFGSIMHSIKQDIERSMVFLEVSTTLPDGVVQSSQGTGFIISEDGYVITAEHLIARDADGNYDKVTANGSPRSPFSGSKLEMDLIEILERQGLMLLKFRDDRIWEPVRTKAPSGVAVGDALYAFGYPVGQDLLGKPVTLASKSGDRGLWQIYADLSPGDSGGVIVTQTGHVVATIEGRLSGSQVMFAIPIGRASTLFDLAGVPLYDNHVLNIADRAPRLDNGSDDPRFFISAIDFGLPEIRDDYKYRRLQTEDLDEIYKDLLASRGEIVFTEEQAARINGIAQVSRIFEHVVPNRAYYFREMPKELLQGSAIYYKVNEWHSKALEWSDLLGDPRHPLGFGEFIRDHVGQFRESSGLFNAIVTMASRRELSLTIQDGDCLKEGSSELVRSTLKDNPFGGSDNVELEFETFVIRLNAEQSMRRAADEVAEILMKECTRTLGGILSHTAQQLFKDVKYYDEYVKILNEIIRSNKPSDLSVHMTIFNPSDVDVFLRSRVRAAVGYLGGDFQDLGDFTITMEIEDASGSYIQVPREGALDVVLAKSLDSQEQEKLMSLRTQGKSYMKIGVIVEDGRETAVTVYSALYPFSDQARKAAEEEVEKIEISI